MIRKSASTTHATAVHEAAHVVIAVAFGIEIGDVSIVANRKRQSHGTTVVWNPMIGWRRGHGDRRSLIDHYAESMYAGRQAEAHFFDTDTSGWTSDDRAASDALRASPFPRGANTSWDEEFFDSYEDKIRSRARAHVTHYAAVIRDFADLLLKKRRMGADEAHALVSGLLARHGHR